MIPGLLYLLLGVGAGFLSGLIGIGGGVFIVPALVFGFGFAQHEAQGTTLALLVPPVGLLAAWTYYKQGYVNLQVAALICIGFLIGGLLGAKLATGISNFWLEKVFGGLLMAISLKMILSK
ncbi:sulfite exporter TauE/SafE family protein [Synechocystis sp. LKSZ1]|uniref:sulfite exporter TauE/SafE family protein n=1 Tax=Synechocystis sp. LKSZ1 TaxID=3144951 RepID=UPI00336C1A4E